MVALWSRYNILTKPRSRMTTAIMFSCQNFFLIVILVLESKALYYRYLLVRGQWENKEKCGLELLGGGVSTSS